MLFTEAQFEEELKRWESRLVKPCTHCDGQGSYPKKGSDKYVMCSCMEEAYLNANLVASGIPRKFLSSSWSWDGFHNNQEALRVCKEYADNFIDNYFNGTGLFIYGQLGRGKSMLEALLAKDIMNQINPDTRKHFRVCFILFPELVTLSHDARNDIKTRQRLNNIIERHDLLIIDNLYSETGSKEYNTKFLELILRKRDNAGTPTILASNHTPEQLISAYSETVQDFVYQNCEQVPVQGDNYRLLPQNNRTEEDW